MQRNSRFGAPIFFSYCFLQKIIPDNFSFLAIPGVTILSPQTPHRPTPQNPASTFTGEPYRKDPRTQYSLTSAKPARRLPVPQTPKLTRQPKISPTKTTAPKPSNLNPKTQTPKAPNPKPLNPNPKPLNPKT